MSWIRDAAGMLALALVLALPPFAASAAPDKAARYFDDAAARFERSDIAGAIVQLKNALQQDPKLLAAHILLGKAYLAQGDPAAAEDALTKALQLGVNRSEIAVPMARALGMQGKYQALLERFPPETVPPGSRAELLLIRGQAFQALGNTDSAHKAYEEARAMDPKYLPAVLSLAELSVQQGRRAEAAKLAEQAMAMAPGDASVWHFTGILALGTGDVQRALDAFAKTLAIDPDHVEARVARVATLMDLGRLDGAAEDVRILAAGAPKEPRALYVRAVYLAKRGDERGSREALEALTHAIDPVPRDVLKQRAADLLLLAALGHHGLGSREKVRQYLDDYISVRPRDVGARRLLASIMIAQRDYRQAITFLEAARKEAPNDPQVLALLGTAHMGLGQHGVASGYLDQALSRSGGAADVQTTFGLNLLGSGQGDLALQHLQEAFKKDPGHPRSGFTLAVLYMRRGEPKRAVEVAEAVVKRIPANAAALNMLGVTRLAADDRSGARRAFQEAIAADAGFTQALLNLGKLDVAENDYAAARKRLESILKKRPSNVQAMYELGLAEQAAGRTSESIRWLEKARATDRRHVASASRLVDAYLSAKAPDKALEVAKDMDAAAPQNLEALAALGRSYLAVGNEGAAQTVFGRMARLAGFDPAWQTRVARYQAAASNMPGALYSLEKALSGQPEYLPAQVLLVEMDLRSGEIAKAEQRARSIIKRVPDQAVGYQLLADTAMARKSYAEAIERYRSALAKERSTEGALRVFGAYVRSGNPKAANEFLESWLRAQPGDITARRALAEGYLHAGNLTAARTSYERILTDQGDEPLLLNNLASILLLQNDPKAAQYAERAFLLAPTNASIQDTLGWALVKQGQVDQGLRHLRDARLREPQNAEIRYHFAAALARAGRNDEARRELEPVVKEGLQLASREEARTLWRELGGGK